MTLAGAMAASPSAVATPRSMAPAPPTVESHCRRWSGDRQGLISPARRVRLPHLLPVLGAFGLRILTHALCGFGLLWWRDASGLLDRPHGIPQDCEMHPHLNRVLPRASLKSLRIPKWGHYQDGADFGRRCAQAVRSRQYAVVALWPRHSLRATGSNPAAVHPHLNQFFEP